MNKADISRIIKIFGEYCNEDIEFGGMYKIENTGKTLIFNIKVLEKRKKVMEYKINKEL